MPKCEKTMKINISSDSLENLSEEGLVLGFFSDEKPPRGFCGALDWQLNGLLSRALAGNAITGSFMEKVLVHPDDNLIPPKILIIGLGELSALTYEKLYQAGSVIAITMGHIRCHDFAAPVPGTGRSGLPVSHMASAFISGFLNTPIDKNPLIESGTILILAEDLYMADIAEGIRQSPAVVENRIPVTLEDGHCTVRATHR